MNISPYLRSIKWRYHISTLEILVVYLLVSWPITLNKSYMALLLFFLFGPLLYGGIYSLNDITDLKEDRNHPEKRKRPLASGKITQGQLGAFSAILMLSALIISYVVNFNLFLLALAFLAINIAYSYLKFKRVPYLEMLLNASTHPLRVYTGLVAAGEMRYGGLAMLVFLFALSIVVLRRKKEIMEGAVNSRHALKYYTNSILAWMLWAVWACLLAFTLLSKGAVFGIGAILVAVDAMILAGYHKTRFFKQFIDGMSR